MKKNTNQLKTEYPSIRAWDTKSHKMLIPRVISMERNYITVFPDNDPQLVSFYKFDQLEFMRGSGFHDKFGKEIFEGDIVDVDYSNDKRINAHEKFVVNWETDNLTFTARFNDSTFCPGDDNILPLCIYKNEQDRLEIVGNKYENPQIMKE